MSPLGASSIASWAAAAAGAQASGTRPCQVRSSYPGVAGTCAGPAAGISCSYQAIGRTFSNPSDSANACPGPPRSTWAMTEVRPCASSSSRTRSHRAVPTPRRRSCGRTVSASRNAVCVLPSSMNRIRDATPAAPSAAQSTGRPRAGPTRSRPATSVRDGAGSCGRSAAPASVRTASQASTAASDGGRSREWIIMSPTLDAPRDHR